MTGHGPNGEQPAIPGTAMVLAAGLGTRMRHLTDNVPKPLVRVAGRPLIDHVLDRLSDAGIAKVVVNLHYHGEQLRAHLAGRPGAEYVFSPEDELLDTGGGVLRALPLIGEDPFWVVNADSLWLDGPTMALQRMARAWNDETMDAMVMVIAANRAMGMDGRGDFFVDARGQVSRIGESLTAPFYFAGVQLVHRRLFESGPTGRFSMNALWDRAIAAGRMWCIVHDGIWCHVGTPEALAEVQEALTEEDMRFLTDV